MVIGVVLTWEDASPAWAYVLGLGALQSFRTKLQTRLYDWSQTVSVFLLLSENIVPKRS